MRRLACLLVLAALAGCARPVATVQLPGEPQLTPTPITSLPGWSDDATATALASFVRGCKAISVMPADQPLGGIGLAARAGGAAGLWQNACAGAKAVPPGDEAAAKSFFAQYFVAYRIAGDALITGYFEPEYPGSKNPAPGFNTPLYARPADPELAVLPRQAIDDGALKRQAPVTAYLADPVDVFMLQIQGSGRITLRNGQVLRVGFDGQNGQPYTPIGRILVSRGDLRPDDVSYQTIRDWLKSHPDEAPEIMEQNARYVFMRPLGYLPDDEGAPGTLGVPLTADRSIAVDSHEIPLGTPVYVSTTDPLSAAPINQLTVAQDTGGGIHGAGQADLYFGGGAQAEAVAGRMRQQGTLFLLLPKPAPLS